jgi:hypothetical protein
MPHRSTRWSINPHHYSNGIAYQPHLTSCTRRFFAPTMFTPKRLAVFQHETSVCVIIGFGAVPKLQDLENPTKLLPVLADFAMHTSRQTPPYFNSSNRTNRL